MRPAKGSTTALQDDAGTVSSDLSVRFVPNKDTHTLGRMGDNLESHLWRVLSDPFHTVVPRPAYPMVVRNGSDRARVVRLFLADMVGQSDGVPHFLPEWVEWRPPSRAMFSNAANSTSNGENGGSGDSDVNDTSVDAFSPDGRTLQLLLLPQERREIALELLPNCRMGETGDYLFAVAGEEVMAGGKDAGNTPVRLAPAVGRLRLVVPQGNLFALLPDVYHEAAREESLRTADGTPSFAERFLLGFEEISDALDSGVNELPRLFAANTAPPDWLRWLATWVGLTLDDRWPEMRRRELIRHAVALYRRRGTVGGLADHLELFTGVRPQISDTPLSGMRLGQTARLGSPDARLGHIAAHTFVVTLSPRSAPGTSAEFSLWTVNDAPIVWDDVTIAALHDIISANKPAHTAYELRVLEEGATPFLTQSVPDAPVPETANTPTNGNATIPPADSHDLIRSEETAP